VLAYHMLNLNMSTENQGQTDRRLRKALREWEVRESLPPRFGDQVWQRIAREETRTAAGRWSGFLGWFSEALARPSLAVSYVAVLLIAGVLAGYWQARSATERASEGLGGRYVQMMDPYR
jgi:hypothetical protein